MKFEEIGFPGFLRQHIEANGGRCVQCLRAVDGSRMVSVIVADEPSRDDGSLERHVSVAVVDNGVKRAPLQSEFRKALKASGVKFTLQIDRRPQVTHAYTDIPSEQ